MQQDGSGTSEGREHGTPGELLLLPAWFSSLETTVDGGERVTRTDVDYPSSSLGLKFRLHWRHVNEGLGHVHPPLKTRLFCHPRHISLLCLRFLPVLRAACHTGDCSPSRPSQPPRCRGGCFFFFFSPYTLLSKSRAGRADTKNTTSSQRIH